MSARVRLGGGDDGLLVARKQASTPSEDAELEHEARILERARHPGVVSLVGLERSPAGRAELITAWVGGHSLATHRPRSVLEAAGTIASVAATVADLHDLGIAHNALRPSHVVVNGEGRPVLCDFASAAAEDVAPPHVYEMGPMWMSRADDVASLGMLMHHLLGDDPDREPIPEARSQLFVLRNRAEHHHRRALRLLADHALAPEPTHRPSARQLALSIRETVPGARLGAPPGNDPPAGTAGRPDRTDIVGHRTTHDDDLERLRATATEPPARTRARAILLPAAASLAAILAVVIINRSAPSRERGHLPAHPGSPEPTLPESPSDGSDTASDPDADSACSAVHPDLVDIDGDGCDDVIEIEDQTVRAAGKAWTVGRAGDSVAAGDWECDGQTTVAVLRPSTGELFVFESWAAPGRPVEVTPTADVDGVVDFDSRPTDGSCGPPRLLKADGTSVDPDAPPPS